ncbi:MAG: hypothetical protein U0470_05215 [Anaerolineae bacterium]
MWPRHDALAQRPPALGHNTGVNPNAQLGCQVHLPILDFMGQDDVCSSWVEVQNIGCEYAMAAMIVWGEPGFCPPQSAGPLKVECTGLLRPGSTWNLTGGQVPTGSKGGIVFKFSARQLSDIGVDVGFDDIVGNYLCELLFFGVVGDADDYRRFKKAYNEGLAFNGVPLDRARGSGYLAVDVLRQCPGVDTPGVLVTSKYNGIAGDHLGAADPVYGGYAFFAPLVYAGHSGFNTILYIQNGGLQCSSLEIWFQHLDDCLRASICDIATLAPGETFQFDAADCVGPDWLGNAWIRASQPMGIAVDIIGPDVLMSYVGEPTEINYTYDPNTPVFSSGNHVAFGPLIYSEYQGWDSGIQVQNMSPVVAAKAKVYFLDRGGDIITTLVDWICPRGSQTFFLPVVFDLPGTWVGSVRVESQEWITPGGPNVLAPNIVAVATLIKYSDPARTSITEGIAYNLLPEHKIFDWQIAPGTRGGLESGIGLIAIPSLFKDTRRSGITSELAIANVVPKPGFTDFALILYDQNGLLDFVCEKLNEKQVEYIDFYRWGYLNNGFKGSAVISATFWEHDVFNSVGGFERNLVGLGAMAIERSRTVLGEDIPGDEAAGDRGIPFALADIRSERCLNGPAPFFDILCPGVPGAPNDPFACPDTVSAKCLNCPLAIPDGGAAQARINVNVPPGCRITDLDVRLDVQHTAVGDLVFGLAKSNNPPGALQFRTLASRVCGFSANMQAILDDDAAQPIGSVCPPSGFARARSQNRTLDAFTGVQARGEWILRVDDAAAGNAGRVNDARLEIALDNGF